MSATRLDKNASSATVQSAHRVDENNVPEKSIGDKYDSEDTFPDGGMRAWLVVLGVCPCNFRSSFVLY